MQNYGIRVELAKSYEDAIADTTDALKTQGFGVLTEIDIKATLKKKLDADFRKYTILGACNPALANQALNAELEVGLLLPCNVIVYEVDDDHSVVSLVDPLQMLGVSDNAALATVAQQADERLRAVAAVLKAA
jgi:uncharacterized protein (DUF302 family)